MTLHLINKSPSHASALADCLHILTVTQETAAVLLIEDGVYAALDSASQSAFETLGLPCYVLREDLEARGLSEKVTGPFRVIDMSDFVKLTLDYAKVQSWG